MNFWRAFVRLLSGFIQDIKFFLKDIFSETYKRLVQAIAAFLVLLIVAIFGIPKLQQLYEKSQYRKENYKPRQICGTITDKTTKDTLKNVLVAVVGQTEDTTRSDSDGYFSLKFTAHKDSTYFWVAFILNGYDQAPKRISIPLSPETASFNQTFTLERKTPEDG